jgi:putative DNA primase/helicase
VSKSTPNSPNGQIKSPDRPAKPPAPEVYKIPVELRSLRQWVLWKYEFRDDAWTKIPYQPLRPSAKAKADVPDTWGSFDLAWEVYQKGGFDGIGFEFSADDEFFGVDVDKCLDEQGQILEWAAPILESLRTTYGEISPSGRGIKFIARGKLPMKTGTRRAGMGDGTGALELYDHGRFFTLTGQRFANGIFPNDLQSAADELYALAKERPKAEPTTPAETSGHDAFTITKNDRENRVLGYLKTCDPAVSGQRGHDVTLRVACAIGPGFNLTEDETFGYLNAHWNPTCQPPWDEKELRRKVSEAFKVESRRGWILDSPGRQSNGHASPNSATVGPPPSTNGAHLGDGETPINLTELGNARRLVKLFGDRIRYCHAWKAWFIWDGSRWLRDESGEIYRLTKRSIQSIGKEAAQCDDEAARKALLKWALQSEAKKIIEHSVFLAQSEPGIPVLPGEWDRHGWLFNVSNGTIDLRTGILKKADPRDYITKICPVAFDPAATCPLWEQTLELFFAKKSKLIAYFQEICGYALVGEVRDHILPVCFGKGQNGKSTILGALLDTFGPDFAMKCPPEMLMSKHFDTHPTDRADLFGKRLVVAIETEQGRRLNETLVKELTGGDRIRARRMKENFFEFEPTHTVLMGTNHKPVVQGTDHAIWRRLRMVPFSVTVEAKSDDKGMPQKLKTERAGILAWCVKGCLRWQKDGLTEPTEVTDATVAYRAEQDILGSFLAEHTVQIQGARIRCGQLYGRYKKWAEGGGEDVLSMTAFGNAMQERGIEKAKSGGKWYLGIGFSQDDEDETES